MPSFGNSTEDRRGLVVVKDEKVIRDKIIQIQCVPVPNNHRTQCTFFIYALDETGRIWSKRGDTDDRFREESLNFVDA